MWWYLPTSSLPPLLFSIFLVNQSRAAELYFLVFVRLNSPCSIESGALTQWYGFVEGKCYSISSLIAWHWYGLVQWVSIWQSSLLSRHSQHQNWINCWDGFSLYQGSSLMIFGERQLMGEEGASGNHCFKGFS